MIIFKAKKAQRGEVSLVVDCGTFPKRRPKISGLQSSANKFTLAKSCVSHPLSVWCHVLQYFNIQQYFLAPRS